MDRKRKMLKIVKIVALCLVFIGYPLVLYLMSVLQKHGIATSEMTKVYVRMFFTGVFCVFLGIEGFSKN